ncbi:response regulator [soil metagenome]
MILIVDDTKENLFSLKALLELNGYEVETADSGEEALKKILKTEFSLIILDVQMPGMDGYEVAETLGGYSKSKSVPILFLSAVNIDKKFITKGYTSGGVDYVTKPFDPDILLLKIKTFTRLYKQNKELSEMQEMLEKKVAARTKELLKINQQLESSNIELQQYAYLASHDLQEPVRKILTFSKLIEDKFQGSNPEMMDYVSRIINSSERMRSLIDDLLNYSKLSAEPVFIQTDLNEILNETLSDLELVIRESKTTIHIEPLLVVDVMPGQIRQVFQNLISNSIKFSKKGSNPCINIKGERVFEKNSKSVSAEEGDFYRITIRDEGIGFNEKYLEKIFGIFQRLHSKVQYEGTGIGLAIVKKIIEKHSGIITAQSAEGVGTTFIMILPLRQNIEDKQEILQD